jgi:AcrR family transcriptional regulator
MSGPTTEGRRTRKKQQTRALIAETALRLFLERGFDAVTVGEIAQAADVDTKTIYNYFPRKPDLVYHRLEAFEDRLLDAVRGRRPGESILAAFARFAIDSQSSGLLADRQPSELLRRVTHMILASETLLAHEEEVFARFTASLASLVAAETDARPSDVEPWLVARTLVGLHRSLVGYVRHHTVAGTSNATLARELGKQARRALARLENGLGDYGVRRA